MTIIRCGKLFTAADNSVCENATLVVENGLIAEVVTGGLDAPEGARVIDLSEKFVMPGLMDAHVHVTMSGEPDMSGMQTMKIGDYALTGLVNARKDLYSGFTSLRDEGAFGFADVSIRNAINRGMFSGPRMLVSGVPLGSTGGHVDSHYNPYIKGETALGVVIDSPDEGRMRARYTFKYGADQVKIMATGGVMSYGDEPGAPELTYEEMKAILDVANSRGRLSSAHAHGAQGIKNAIRAGISSIEHGMMIDDEGIEMLAASGVYLVPTIIAAWQIIESGVAKGVPAYAVEKAKICLEHHGENLRKMIARGVKIAFGTDAGTPFNLHGQQTLEFELMVRYGFSPLQALVAATRTNAELFRWSQAGTLEKGKFADVTACDASPLDDITAMRSVSFVMKGGEVIRGGNS